MALCLRSTPSDASPDIHTAPSNMPTELNDNEINVSTPKVTSSSPAMRTSPSSTPSYGTPDIHTLHSNMPTELNDNIINFSTPKAIPSSSPSNSPSYSSPTLNYATPDIHTTPSNNIPPELNDNLIKIGTPITATNPSYSPTTPSNSSMNPTFNGKGVRNLSESTKEQPSPSRPASSLSTTHLPTDDSSHPPNDLAGIFSPLLSRLKSFLWSLPTQNSPDFIFPLSCIYNSSSLFFS